MPRNPLDIDSVIQCHECPTLGEDQVPSEGDPNADIMIIGRDPGATEVELRRPFVGPCGEIVNYVLDEAGLDRTDIYITNAVKCHTPSNRGPHPEEIRMCARQWLYREIELVKPRVLVTLGKDAQHAVFHATAFKHLGLIKGKNRIAIMAWHPSYALRRGIMQEYVPALGALIKQCLTDTKEQ